MKYYGEVVTIKSVNKDFYRIKEDGGQYCWTDEMIECKVVEEYKPELKFKVGDKVRIKSYDWYNINKDKDGFVHCGDSVFDNYMSVFCGSVVTIGEVGLYGYGIREDLHCRTWTDEMIKGLVEEETKPKFKVGDKITSGKATLTILKLLSEKYVVEDNFGECGILYFNSQNGWKIVEEEEIEFTEEEEIEFTEEDKFWCDIMSESDPTTYVLPQGYQFKDENGNVINAQKIVLEKLLSPKFKKGDRIKDKGNRVWYVVQVGNKHYDISHIPDGLGYFVPMEDQDDYELFPDRELPKTFEECVSVLEGENRMSLELMNTFRKLIDARNAYWKIAGEEMGLGKLWEPDWTNYNEYKFVIGVNENKIIKCYNTIAQFVLAFPTEEMRDAFYENFKEEIKICKELL
jgi:co-chaperonin GroES (HSP10)